MTEIVKKYYIDEKSYITQSEKLSIEELNNKILKTSEINKKYKNITSCKISSDLYLENLKRIYKVEQNNELWRKYPDNKDLRISNLGRVKFHNTMLNFIDKEYLNGYLYLDFENFEHKPKIRDRYVYQMVASTWLLKPETYCQNSKYEVHHISNDGYNNCVENLIYLTEYEHSQINHKIRE